MRAFLPLLLAIALSGCPGKPAETPEQCASENLHKADRKLAAGRLHEARAAYDDALACVPNHRYAALGTAVLDALLVLDSPPIAAFLDACHRPRFDVEHHFFGPDGLLAREAEAGEGEARLTAHMRSAPGDAFTDTHFAPNVVRTVGPQFQLRLSATNDAPFATFVLQLNPDDLYSQDDEITPLIHGAPVDLTRPGPYVFVAIGDWYSSSLTQGTALFEGDWREGGTFTLQLEQLSFTACHAAGTGTCSGELRVEGTVSDTHSPPIFLPRSEQPLGAPIQGPPFISPFIGFVQTCGAKMTDDALVETALALAERLDRTREKLDIALADGPDQVSFVLPRTLLRTQRDLQLNGADALALRAATRATTALLRWAATYDYFEGPLADHLDDRERCALASEPSHRVERTLVTPSMADSLAQALFRMTRPARLLEARADLQGALEDASAALRHRGATPGAFSFRAPRAAAFSDEVASALDTFRESLSSQSPRPMPFNPRWNVHLRQLFERAPDRERLLEASGAPRLVSFEAGDPQASSCEGRNDALAVVLPSLDALEAWTHGALRAPARPPQTPCESDETCGNGYVCTGSPGAPGECDIPAPVFLPPSFSTAHDTGSPAYLSSALEALFNGVR